MNPWYETCFLRHLYLALTFGLETESLLLFITKVSPPVTRKTRVQFPEGEAFKCFWLVNKIIHIMFVKLKTQTDLPNQSFVVTEVISTFESLEFI